MCGPFRAGRRNADRRDPGSARHSSLRPWAIFQAAFQAAAQGLAGFQPRAFDVQRLPRFANSQASARGTIAAQFAADPLPPNRPTWRSWKRCRVGPAAIDGPLVHGWSAPAHQESTSTPGGPARAIRSPMARPRPLVPPYQPSPAGNKWPRAARAGWSALRSLSKLRSSRAERADGFLANR